MATLLYDFQIEEKTDWRIKMKRMAVMVISLCLCLALFSQEKIFVEESLVVNVEVPIRVFDGSRFVDNLTFDDFEVYEDGVQQKIEAVYLINKSTVERREENKKTFSPDTSRSFYILFEISNYTPRLNEALEYLGQEVILPSDELIIVTPMKSYKLKDKALEIIERDELVNQMKAIIRKDCLEGSSEYRSALRDLTNIARVIISELSEGTADEAKLLDSLSDASNLAEQVQAGAIGPRVDEQLFLYQGLLHKLEVLREVEQMKYMDFAQLLKEKKGQKNVILFYEEESIPQIEPRILLSYITAHEENPNIMMTINGIMNFNIRDITFDVDLVKKTFADASVAIHFLFINRIPDPVAGIRFEDRSEDIFGAFHQMAKATGGFIESSTNPGYLFKRAIESSENYYLLYYAPQKSIEGERRFRKIEVKVKDKKYRVTHRQGYFTE
jgi:VWFA-related protein